MKLFVSFLIGGLLGLAVGYELASHLFFAKLVADLRLAEHSLASEQRFGTTLSLAALTKLEAGEIDKAKSFLAHQIADYSRTSFDASLPKKQRLAPFIDAVRAKSPTLQQEFAKKLK